MKKWETEFREGHLPLPQEQGRMRLELKLGTCVFTTLSFWIPYNFLKITLKG